MRFFYAHHGAIGNVYWTCRPELCIIGGMDVQPITTGALRLRQLPSGELELTHTGKAGSVKIIIPAEHLARWLMRRLRDEAFA